AAYSSAIEVVKYGAEVANIECDTVGGTCVNLGGVLSKTLQRTGEINHLVKSIQFIEFNPKVLVDDLTSLIEQKNELVTDLRNSKYVDLIDEYGFELIKGEAKFVDEKTVEVNGMRLSAKRFLIATGASPAVPNIPGLDEVDYLTSTTLLE